MTNDHVKDALPIRLSVSCATHVFQNAPAQFDTWGPINFFVGPNGSGKTTFFNAVMSSARSQFPNRVKILGTGRLGPLEKSVAQWIGDPTSRLFQEENLESVYNTLFSGQDTAHQAFQVLEKRLDLQIRVLGFLRHVFKRSLQFKSTRRGLMVLGASAAGAEYQIIDECHGLKELITILTFLYDDTFAVLGIDEPELHLHPQFQRFLFDELKAVAGDPALPGKKLIFLVTHSPILLELRSLADLASIVVFTPGASPSRAAPDAFDEEDRLKIRQALPSFHAAQRELLFSNTPIILEGPFDASILMNVAARLELPLGAAGIGLTSMGGKYQLRAFRALTSALAKPNARFILDLDAVIDAKALNCLDADQRVIKTLQTRGLGDRTLTRVIGELITLLRKYVSDSADASTPILQTTKPIGDLTEADLALVLRTIRSQRLSGSQMFDSDRADAILGKVEAIRDAAAAANVWILSRGSIEAYYADPPSLRPTDYEKQQALQGELDAIWAPDAAAELATRYQEIISFVRGAGLLHIPLSALAREPIGDLVHLLQSEIVAGRVSSLEDAKASRAKAEGYWHICELLKLEVQSRRIFAGSIQVKRELGGEIIGFDQETRAYELTTNATPVGLSA
jgi:predicted ATPase